MRKFDTGATRSPDAGRIDPEGFLSPLSIERYCEYLLKHRKQADGSLRDSDNWQKGMPLSTYIKGMWRHFLHAWQRHRGWIVVDPKAAANIEEDLCAIIFNAQGYLHEILVTKRVDLDTPPFVSQEMNEPGFEHQVIDMNEEDESERDTL